MSNEIKGSVFPVLSMDRSVSKWEDHMYDLTPVQEIEGMHFKREDWFAPLGYGGINGSKMRQGLYLGKKYLEGKTGYLLSGTSCKSPQLPMGSAIATHFGNKSLHVLGATKPETAPRREMVQMGTWFGAEWDFINIGYNHNLQLRVQSILEKRKDQDFYLEYGITLDHKKHSSQEVFDFHQVGAYQVKNIPFGVTDLVLPAGSCNSSTSILLGLVLHRWPSSLKRIHLIGIGPSKLKYLTERLELFAQVCGQETRVFKGLPYEDDLMTNVPLSFPLEALYYDLHGTGYVNYQDEMQESWGGIELHPTYEAKVLRYVKERLPHLLAPTTLFWIVGSKPRIEAMRPYYSGVRDPGDMVVYKGAS